MYHLHFAHPSVFYLFLPVFAALIIYRWFVHKTPVLTFPLAGEISKSKHAQTGTHKKAQFTLKALLLASLIFMIARPQWVDSRSRVNVNGVDIIIALDVSGSMQLFDDKRNPQKRIDIAKREAIRFIHKRENDPMGIVIFGADAVSRCPLTLDKTILAGTTREIKLGVISENGTSLGTGIATAISKLQKSKAKSKIIILLTDGRPTPETEKITIDQALELAKQFNIKIYAIGIGNKRGGYVQSAFGFIEQIPDAIDEKLLQHIANKTGGRFFRASKPQEMKQIYDTIDALEKTEYQTNLFSRYYEAFATFIWGILLLLFIELICSLFIWRGVL